MNIGSDRIRSDEVLHGPIDLPIRISETIVRNDELHPRQLTGIVLGFIQETYCSHPAKTHLTHEDKPSSFLCAHLGIAHLVRTMHPTRGSLPSVDLAHQNSSALNSELLEVLLH